MAEITPMQKKISRIRLGKQFSRPEDRDQLTEKIIACCYRVHSELGPGFNEKVYHSALRMALDEAGLEYDSEKQYRVVYQGEKVGALRIDLIVQNEVIVEVKALANRLPELFKYQVISYLKVSRLRVGLLVNFGTESCEVKRLSS